MNERDILIAALQQEDPVQRRAYLDEACAKQPKLRKQVEELLRLYDGAGSFLERTAAESAATGAFRQGTEQAAPHEHSGLAIGPYKLLEQIGEGGMGTVWMAQQTDPVKRVVALKLIKAGMDSRQVIARFEAERQALALMDHANIARVLDAGTTNAGRPYFVMDLVKGVPITKYCDQHHLTPRQRLELLIPVCHAIQHAHQKGIIHRDIKPSNVLVALYDGRPVPKVIDFGVAKATGVSLTEKTLVTGFGAIVGTFEYMSPEQAEVNQLDIDTRSDIYSLGVLLYELMTGSPPFTRQELEKAGMLEMLRLIREQEPSKPSTKLSTADGLPTLAANRGTEPAKLTKLVRGDLDWIVMKCLEKDRMRRYETANQLSLELQRYLADEPVQAGPPGAAYRIRKFARRHRVGVAAGGLVLAAILAGAAGTTVGMIRAETQREKAEAAEKLAIERLAQVQDEQIRTDEQRKIAQAVREFLQVKLLGQADAQAQANLLLQSGRFAAEIKADPTVRELLDRAADQLSADRIEDVFAGQSLVQAEILATVGEAYRAVGEYKRSIEFLQRAVAKHVESHGANDRATLVARASLALSHFLDGSYTSATELFEQVRAAQTVSLGADHADTFETTSLLASAHLAAGKHAEAVKWHEVACRGFEKLLGPENQKTLQAQSNLAGAYRVGARYGEAIDLFERVLLIQRKKLGPDHLDTMDATIGLAATYEAVGRLPDAIPLYEQVATNLERQLGPEHPFTLTAQNNLGLAYQTSGAPDRGIQMLTRVHASLDKRLGPGHPQTLIALGNLASAQNLAGRFDEAIQLHQRVVDGTETSLGLNHTVTLKAKSNLAGSLRMAGRFAEAINLFKTIIPEQTSLHGEEHEETLHSVVGLAAAYEFNDQLAEAIPLYSRAAKALEALHNAEHPFVLATKANLAGAFQKQGKLDEAANLFVQVLESQKRTLGPEHFNTITTTANLASLYTVMNRTEEAIAMYQEAARGFTAALGPNHSYTLQTSANLGIALRDSGRLEESIPILQDVCQKGRKDPHMAGAGLALADAYFRAGKLTETAQLVPNEIAAARALIPTDGPRFASLLANAAELYLQLRQYVDAETALRECLAVREKLAEAAPQSVLPWQIGNAQSMLGEALSGQQRFDEAEPLLKAGHEGLEKHSEMIPPQAKNVIAKSLRRLVAFYEMIGKPEEAAKWKARL